MSLTDELAKTRANAVKHLPPEKYAVMQANVLALRNSGIETGGPASLSSADRQAFANQLDRLLSRAC